MLQDLRFVLRSFSRQRGFTAVAILTVALGVALTTTTFSVADNVLYRPLPYLEPDDLYELVGANRGDTASRVSGAVGDYLAWRETGVFSSLGASRHTTLVVLTGGAEPRRVLSASVDEHFLPTLAVQPAIGRPFEPDDCREGARPVILISSGMWRTDFGGDPAVIGRVIEVDSTAAEIVGVLPADFLFPISTLASSAQRVEVLRPLIVPAAQRQDHNIRGYRAIGRLAPGVSLGDAQARLDAAQQAVRPRYRPTNVRPGAFDGVRMLPLASAMVGRPTRAAVTLLLVAALAVLLVACVNIANMLLARGAERERELAVRAAIGASRARIARLVLVEAVTIALIGGAVGFVLARPAFGVLLTRLPARFVTVRMPEMDARVAVFAILVSLVVGIVFGLLPALRQSRSDFSSAIKKTGAGGTARMGWTRDALVFTEVALAVMLVGAGALVLRSFANVLRVAPGLDRQHVLTLQITPPPRLPRAATAERSVFFRNLLDTVQAVPGVEGAALTNNLLMGGGFYGTSLALDGIAASRLYTRGNSVTEVGVTADYFRVMGIPLLAGTAFPREAVGDEPLAIVSTRVGRFTGVDPLGREVVSVAKSEQGTPSPRRYRVIGVAADVRDRGLDSEPLSIFYLPFSGDRVVTLLVRGDQPIALAPAVTKAIHALEPGAAVDQVRTLDDLIQRSLAERRFNALLYAAFSVSALLLSAIGVYGVVAYAVSRRTREIGIRAALGADSRELLIAMSARPAAVFAGGVVAGIAGLLALGGVLRSLLFELAPTDPSVIGSSVLILLIAAGGAILIPARRAARVDPVVALRVE
jgi:putative ABC transport system permease protein